MAFNISLDFSLFVYRITEYELNHVQHDLATNMPGSFVYSLYGDSKNFIEYLIQKKKNVYLTDLHKKY